MNRDTTQLILNFSCANGQSVSLTVRKPIEGVDCALLHQVAQEVIRIGTLSDTTGSPARELASARIVRKKWHAVCVMDN